MLPFSVDFSHFQVKLLSYHPPSPPKPYMLLFCVLIHLLQATSSNPPDSMGRFLHGAVLRSLPAQVCCLFSQRELGHLIARVQNKYCSNSSYSSTEPRAAQRSSLAWPGFESLTVTPAFWKVGAGLKKGKKACIYTKLHARLYGWSAHAAKM